MADQISQYDRDTQGSDQSQIDSILGPIKNQNEKEKEKEKSEEVEGGRVNGVSGVHVSVLGSSFFEKILSEFTWDAVDETERGKEKKKNEKKSVKGEKKSKAKK
jgi:hypothetical protein